MIKSIFNIRRMIRTHAKKSEIPSQNGNPPCLYSGSAESVDSKNEYLCRRIKTQIQADTTIPQSNNWVVDMSKPEIVKIVVSIDLLFFDTNVC